jgi:GTPase SAR1 family protein
MFATTHRFAVVYLGDSGVGKTSIINQRIVCGFDVHRNSTAGIDQPPVTISLHGESVLLLVVGSILDENSLQNLVAY